MMQEIRDRLDGEIVRAVHIERCEYDDEVDDPPHFVERMVLETDNVAVEVTVDADTDELIVQCGEKGGFDLKPNAQSHRFPELLDKYIIGVWFAVNQKGYFDLFALGVDEFLPNVIISCQASSLYIRLAGAAIK
ncbi:hypothetical protein HNQ91_001971 [Filimonas zeae]|uniref:Uncharacterized protein n=1 Tax=Filimonas zeae TaxID=1737353 RepID=A0A917MVD9_9BACT|nr:DUF6334 family protein [Filimonas zeae]MDR6338920.1 hypothetical protein [Filimonas zeae]GGH65958.1 hypothetical protein GCM10011379_19630 [Filimonas zeae]